MVEHLDILSLGLAPRLRPNTETPSRRPRHVRAFSRLRGCGVSQRQHIGDAIANRARAKLDRFFPQVPADRILGDAAKRRCFSRTNNAAAIDRREVRGG